MRRDAANLIQLGQFGFEQVARLGLHFDELQLALARSG